ncbi:hypothetical protein [Spirillospora sp. CA-128828]|uniref:hypothetical protein n=1 Tax=Spirillospora sp. CA-128828 TaxID=3240033 RepID=UPI003D921EA6
MTTPAQPDTGNAGAAPDTGTAPETDPTSEQTAPGTGDVDWQAEAEKYKALARKHEQRAKDNKKALDEAQAKAQPAEGEPDWQAKAEEADARADAAEVRAVELAYEATVNRVARDVGADAEALLDSQAFRDAVAEELDDDFDDDDLREAVNTVAKRFVKKSRFAAQRPAGGASGGDFTGSPGAAASIDQQIADAEKRRDFTTAIALKRQRAALK